MFRWFELYSRWVSLTIVHDTSVSAAVKELNTYWIPAKSYCYSWPANKRHTTLPACRCLLFPLLHAEKVPFPRATKEIGDVCTQATYHTISYEQSIATVHYLTNTDADIANTKGGGGGRLSIYRDLKLMLSKCCPVEWSNETKPSLQFHRLIKV